MAGSQAGQSAAGTASGSGHQERSASTSASKDEAIANRLTDPNVDLGLKVRAAQELRDEVSREAYQGSVEYVRFVELLLPAILHVLGESPTSQWVCIPEARPRLLADLAQSTSNARGTPNANNQGVSGSSPPHKHTSDALHNSTRHLLLESLHRLVHHEPLKARAADLMQLLLKLMHTENEENAILALKIIIDLHRTYKDVVGETATEFLDVVKKVYENMPEVVAKTFGDEDGYGALADGLELEDEDGNFIGNAEGSTHLSDAVATPHPGSTTGDAATPASGATNAGTPVALRDSTLSAPPLSARSMTNMGLSMQDAQQQLLQQQQLIRKVPLGIKSLKLLAECPIAVVFLFQNYKEVAPTELRLFVPLVFAFLELQAAPQRKAHEDALARGETCTGITPVLSSPNRRAALTDLVIAEIKTMSFVAYFLRMNMQALVQYKDIIPEVVVRLLKDCPSESAAHRRELLIASRHILQSEFRHSFLAYVDTLVDDRVLIGFGQTCREQLRPLAYSMIADLVHHVREELSIVTLSRVIHIYSCDVHDPTLALSIQTMCSKLLLNVTENVVRNNGDEEESVHILNRSLEAFTAKVESVAATRDMYTRWKEPLGTPRPPGEPIDETEVERQKPIAAAATMVEPATDLLRDARFLLRNLIFALKTTVHGLKALHHPTTDTNIISRLFVAITGCMTIFDYQLHMRPDGVRERNEVMEGFVSILLAIDPLVFVEVVEPNMPYFLEELMRNQELLAIPQSILADGSTSHLFTGIVFRFLRARLEKIGTGDADFDAIVLRLFKMSFMAVTIFPEPNEVVLQPHLSHFIMHSLKLASKAVEPHGYYLLLRVLFRSIGGGRFELLYKEVIPLLEILLTILNNLLEAASDRNKRDLFVELCLTVPVRLSVLLPYLSYLMKPLVLSLQAAPDLIGQGLRTLELCVDNLTPEFLNPLLAPVQAELQAALWKLLRPIPYNHHHAHTTVRILGKIGGRNRKSLGPPILSWKNVTDEATTPFSFDGKKWNAPISTIVNLATRMTRRGDVHYRKAAYQVLKHAAVTFLKDTLSSGDQETCFGDVLSGLFEACRIEEYQSDATAFVGKFARYIFVTEMARQPLDDSVNKLSLPLSSAFMDAIVENLAIAQISDEKRLTGQLADILQGLVAYCKEHPPARSDLPAALLHQLAIRMGSLCYDHYWQRKSGGALGIDTLVRRVALDELWLIQHEGELVRALLFMLKDMPHDPPGNVDQVVGTILYILRACNDQEKASEHQEEREKAQKYIIGFLVIELASQVEIVRHTAQKAFAVLAETNKVTLTDLIQPVKARLLNPIFTKPLRALAFPMQIGHMDAITFCMTLDPPLLELEADKDRQEGAPPKEMELNLGRLLTEALGIADADDTALTGGKTPHHANTTQLTQLRIVCIRLLSAAMGSADFVAPKHNTMRTKILQVYFKLLYSKSAPVVEAAYDCLKLPVQQGKLPKDLLQSGLRPVLVNLGDHKRLTVDSLQSLARLLELLPNYFKVEIGQKLLDHFRSLADPSTLTIAALAPQSENCEMNVMAAIINVFHLLPYPGASSFIADVCSSVVDVEKRTWKIKTSPFTTPLAKYVCRYAEEAGDLFVSNIHDEAWASTLCQILLCDSAGAFRDHMAANASVFLAPAFTDAVEGAFTTLNAAKIILALSNKLPDWLVGNEDVINRLVSRWTTNTRKSRLLQRSEIHMSQVREDVVFLEIFKAYLTKTEPSPLSNDLLFRMTDVFTFRTPVDTSGLASFLFQHVANSRDIPFRQAILRRFIDFFTNDGIAPAHKTMALRYLINPLLVVAFSRGEEDKAISDPEYMNMIHARVWQPWLLGDVASGIVDDALRIEGLYMATIIVRHRWSVMLDCRKDVIKLGWSYMKTPDVTTKTAAHCLIAQFLAVYESKPKILMPIYTTLLRSHQTEAKTLVIEALNVLTPELPTKCPQLESGIHPWLRATRHIMIEDGHGSMSQLSHILQLIIRFPNVFYERRDLFIPHMVSALPKLCLLSSATPESRILALELVELILNWEVQRIKSAKDEEASRMDVDGAVHEEPAKMQASPKRMPSVAPSTTSQSSSHHNYTIPLSTKDSIINGSLVRFIASNPEPARAGGMVKTGLDLLRKLLSVWPDVSIKFAFLHRVLGDPDMSGQSAVMLCNTVDILSIVLTFKSNEWVRENVAALHKVVERGMLQQDQQLHIAYKPVLQRLFSVLPTSAQQETPGHEALKAFSDWASNVIDVGLRDMASLHSNIIILEAWAAATPDAIAPFMITLVKVVNVLAKEHLNHHDPDMPPDVNLRLLRSCFGMLRTRMAVIGEHRRWILGSLCMLVEKSPNLNLCRYILEIATQWVLEEHKEAFPTLKEKATLLGKMMVFEHRPEESHLLRDFLQVILRIYSDPVLKRSDYTVRLEQPFLLGCRNRLASLRWQFMEVFDEAITRSIGGRLNYLFGVQSWETLGETNWIHQALDLLMGAIAKDDILLPSPESTFQTDADDAFVRELQGFKTGAFIDNARKLLYSDPEATYIVWCQCFKAAWFSLSRKEQGDISQFLIILLTKDYHLQNVDRRPNVIQTLLAGVLACTPTLPLPPHLVRYLGKTYNAYHIAIELLQNLVNENREEESIRESSLDALAEIYAELSEDDSLYGLWRRRAFFSETNISISFEQAGLWGSAQQMYENAQMKARSGSLPFTESEYTLWEDHWIMCAEKLQHWDILSDLAKNEGNNDLLLECSWRLSDWATEHESIAHIIDNAQPAPTPRKRVFEALAVLVRGPKVDGHSFQRVCDEGIQFSLRKWYHLPDIVSDSHIPLLHIFQQFVELQEASKYIFGSLENTTAANLDQRSAEIKSTLQMWRDRLPNLWDDVNIWSDLVAWRQHVFQAINRAYLPLLPNKDGQAAASTNSHAYRGYHETAWIINRFAHVARKHQLTDVCITSLTKIYTLPNIEIQEAFLKLREQAKSHYQNPNELTQGLEVINNTNLAYFNLMQKSEFYTLKGMFLARLGLTEEANQVFTQAVTMDMSFPKVWAEYGRYHDRLFKQEPNDLNRAANAVACYLQAAGLYKSAKVRKLLVRILWLLSLDDASGTVSKAFDSYTGELPVWYWITFAPQLIAGLSSREARYARIILLQIAKKFPQGLFFHLRTSRDELASQQKTAHEAEQKLKAASSAASVQSATPQSPGAMAVDVKEENSQGQPNGSQTAGSNGTPSSGSQPAPAMPRTPLDYVEEISSVLKTAFPLLALSLELVCDQISARFKAVPDEDIFRLVTALLQDGLQQYINRTPNPDDNGLLAKGTTLNITRFAQNLPSHLKEAFHQDFVASEPNLRQYVQNLQVWRDRYEKILDRKPKRHPLETLSHWLVEYKYQTFDEIEVPGQYLRHEDGNRAFVKISYFGPKVDVGRLAGSFTRKITIVGYDGSSHVFQIQLPMQRGYRREEKISQLFRMLNSPLQKRVESRKRGLQFHLPLLIPVGQHCRLVESSPSIISLQDIYERYCTEVGMSKDDPIMAYTEKLKELLKGSRQANFAAAAAKLEVYIEVATKLFPDTILRDFFIRSTPSACELWHTRKQTAQHLAAFIFQSYLFSVGRRLPTNILFTRASGQMHSADLIPALSSNKPEFSNHEAVPFRLTPNLQAFVGPIGVEGVLVSALMSIARCMTESEYDLEHRLSIFVSEEMQFWHTSRKMPKPSEAQLRDLTLTNVDAVVRRAKLLSCKIERERTPIGSTPVSQSILDLLTHATNPLRLASVDVASLPWL